MMIADFKKRFWISLVVTVPILLLSPLIQKWIGLDWQFPGEKFVLFGLSSFIFFYGGFPFLRDMIKELKDHSPGMMTLIGVAIIVAYGYSSVVVFGLEGKTVVYVLINDKLAGFIALSDQIRPESAGAVKTLHENDIKTVMITGDNAAVAGQVSKGLGIGE
ncbi:MAG: HAD family hydrolase [Saprospiraceae bacterium]|nr:HAD family hydrolase [Lewinella sp.]